MGMLAFFGFFIYCPKGQFLALGSAFLLECPKSVGRRSPKKAVNSLTLAFFSPPES